MAGVASATGVATLVGVASATTATVGVTLDLLSVLPHPASVAIVNMPRHAAVRIVVNLCLFVNIVVSPR